MMPLISGREEAGHSNVSRQECRETLAIDRLTIVDNRG